MTQLVRALVVDDEEPIRLFLREVLRREGHVVTTATNGEEALAYLEDTAAELHLSRNVGQQLESGPFSVDFDSRCVTRNGEAIALNPSEFALLVHLMQNANQVVGPKALVEVVRQYRPEYLHEARQIIKWYIHRLRRKMEPDPASPRYIVNVRGVGYMFQP